MLAGMDHEPVVFGREGGVLSSGLVRGDEQRFA